MEKLWKKHVQVALLNVPVILAHSGKGICIVLRLYIFMQKDNFSSLRIVGCDNLYKKSIRERITRSSKIKLFFLADN